VGYRLYEEGSRKGERMGSSIDIDNVLNVQHHVPAKGGQGDLLGGS